MTKVNLLPLPRYNMVFSAAPGNALTWQEVLDRAADAFVCEQRDLFRRYRKLHTLTEAQVRKYANSVRDIVTSLQHGFTPDPFVKGDEPDVEHFVLGYKADGSIGTLHLGFWY